MTFGLELFMGHGCHNNLLNYWKAFKKSDTADLTCFKKPMKNRFDDLGVSENRVISCSPFIDFYWGKLR